MKPESELGLSPVPMKKDESNLELDVELSGAERKRRFSRRTSEDLTQFQGAIQQARANLQMANGEEERCEERNHPQAAQSLPSAAYRSILKTKGSSRASSPDRRVTFHSNVLVWAAAEDGDLKTCKALLKSEKRNRASVPVGQEPSALLDINMSNHENVTLLHLLCFLRDVEAVKLVLDLGANTNAVDREGWTPLHIAVALNQRDLCIFLVENGAKTQYDDECSAVDLIRVSDGAHVKPLVEELDSRSALLLALS